MRLLTHNLLQCNKKGVNNGYPLIVRSTKLKVEESEFNSDMLMAMLPKVEWSALYSTVESLRETAAQNDITIPSLPAESPLEGMDGEVMLDASLAKALHFVLFDLHVVDGTLICPESAREFPIEQGIPNMLLHDDEV